MEASEKRMQTLSMQCKFCGQQLPDNAVCCTRCGGSLIHSTKKMTRPKAREEELVFNIKPAFDMSIIGVRAFFMALFIAAVATSTIGTFCTVALSLLGFLNCSAAFYVTGGVFFVATFFLFIYVAKKNTMARKFTFYQNKMEYTYNAFDGKFRYLEYSAIIDSSVTKGPLQKMSNLGNISFVCVGSFHDYVVAIGDVRDPDYVYKKVLDLIEISKELHQ